MPQPHRRLELIFWAILPGLITLLLLIFCLAPKHMGGLNNFMPLLALIPVFYWGLHHAREMPYWFVFFVGIINDDAAGVPLGLTSLSYLFFLALLRTQRKYIHKEGFLIKWVYFSILLLATSCLNWLFMSMLNSRFENLLPAFIQWLLTVGCYPLFHQLFDVIYKHINDRRWHILHGH